MIKPFDIKCTACNACKTKCPKEAIHLDTAPFGFYYPVIDETLCVKCGLCDKVCPIDKNLTPFSTLQKAYAAVNLTNEVLLDSTSGGVFSAVALWILERQGVVYGCAYGDNLKPIHIRIDDTKELYRLRGSKYVQSDTENTFAEAESDLRNGKLVLYTGTPCQIDGLRHYLSKEYDNLFCIDLICHGVASSEYFIRYISYLENKIGGKIDSFSFRDKKNKGWSLSGTYSGTYSGTNNHFIKKLNYFDSYYYSYFLSGEIYRESCYNCKYAQITRVGDFTLGDLWGAEGLNLPFDVQNGCSVVLLNTNKAHDIWKELNLKWREIKVDKAVQYNAQLRKPSDYKESRLTLSQEYLEHDAAWIQKNFERKNFRRNLIGRIKYSIPKPFKAILLKLKYRN